MLVSCDPGMAPRASLAGSASRAESLRDPSCGLSSLLATPVCLMNVLTIIPGRAGCVVSHGSVWQGGMCHPRNSCGPIPMNSGSPGVGVTLLGLGSLPQRQPQDRNVKSPQTQPHFGSFGMSPTALSPEQQPCWGGPCRSLSCPWPCLSLCCCCLSAYCKLILMCTNAIILQKLKSSLNL